VAVYAWRARDRLTFAAVLALTTAQTIFSIALGVMAVLITGFGIYVVSSTMWGDRWYQRNK
jgi:hypothetical protein